MYIDTSIPLYKVQQRKKVLHLGRISPRHQYRLGTIQLESSLAAKDLGDTRKQVEHESAKSPCC